MIYIRVELWPHGDESRKREIGTAIIDNVGGSVSTGNYRVRLLKSAEYAKRPGVWKQGAVTGFPRLRLGPWDLLFRALASCAGMDKRNPNLSTIEEISDLASETIASEDER